MTRVTRSSAFALALGYVALGIAALALFAAPLWYAWQVMIDDGRIELIQEDVQRLTEVFQHRGDAGLAAFIDARVGMQIAGERILLLSDPALKPLAGNLPDWPREVPPLPGAYTVTLTLSGHPTRVVLVRAVLPGGYNLLVGRDVTRFTPVETRFWYGLAGSITVLSLVGLCGGLLVRRAVLSGIDKISRSVSTIVDGDLNHRLPVGTRNDEVDTLSRTINRMFDQIEQLVHGVRNVSNSIAHDLRTPLAELRSRLEELAIERPGPDETFAEILGAVEDVDRVIGIFNALLRLAEIDTGARRSGFVAVNAADVAARAVEFYQPAAELRGIGLSFREMPGEVAIAGDPVLLAQAVGNLIDNALKFTPPNGAIVVETVPLPDGGVEISVADNGPGIPDAEKPHVTERFYRGDASRGTTPGVGLGLSLVGAVATLHLGRLELVDNSPGLKASMVLAGPRGRPATGKPPESPRPSGAIAPSRRDAPVYRMYL